MKHRKWIVIFTFFALFLVRVPYLAQIPIGEENMYFVTSQLAGQDESYKKDAIGICQNKIIREFPAHPFSPFFIFDQYGKLYKSLVSIIGNFTISLTVWLRGIQTLLFCLFCSIILVNLPGFFGQYSEDRKFSFLVIATGIILFSTPLMVGTSIQMQQEGSLGCILYLGIISVFTTDLDRFWKLACFALFCFFLGFEKPERLFLWLTARATAYVLTTVLVSSSNDVKRMLRFLFLEAFAITVGIAAEIKLDGVNWNASIELATSFIGNRLPPSLREYLFTSFVPFATWPILLIVLAGTGFCAYRNSIDRKSEMRRGNVLQRLNFLSVLGFGWLIVLGALKARWYGDGFPRYLAPGILAFIPACFFYLSGCSKRALSTVLIAVGIVSTVMTLYQFLSLRGLSVTSRYNQPIPALDCKYNLNSNCLTKIRFECVQVVSGDNWVFEETIGAIGDQCRLPICKG